MGIGVYCWSNGDKYDGEFLMGQMSGKGKMEYANGDVYVGA